MNRPALQLKSMLEDDPSDSDDNWMLSYIDVFVLMTTLFIMLVVINRPVPANPVTESSSTPTTHVDARQTANNTKVSAQITQAQQRVEHEEIVMIDAPLLAHHEWINEMEQVIEANDLNKLVQLNRAADYTEVEISSRVLFDSGDAELTRPGEVILESLIPLLKRTAGDVFIEGHTDDQPIETSRFPSNWELASARATEVLQFFVSEDLARERFRAVSYADTKPLVPNDSADNRQVNRRVSLVVHR